MSRKEKFTIMLRTRVPSGWGEWRVHERWIDRDQRDIRLDRLQNKSGYDPERFEFKAD